MRNRIIVLTIAVLAVAAFVAVSMGRAQEPAPAQRANQFAGGADHTASVPSVPPPEGWKACPRCQNQKDRADSAAKNRSRRTDADGCELPRTTIRLICYGSIPALMTV